MALCSINGTKRGWMISNVIIVHPPDKKRSSGNDVSHLDGLQMKQYLTTRHPRPSCLARNQKNHDRF